MTGLTKERREQGAAKLRELDVRIAKDPNNAMWHWHRGAALASVGNIRGAQEAIEKAIALLPGYADAWVSLGEIHARLGNRTLAKRAFRSAVDIEPLTEGALAGYAANARLPEFLAWGLRTALRERWQKLRRRAKCPDAAQAAREAVILGDRGHIAAAIDVLRRALARCPGNVYILKYLGAYLVVHGNKQQSRQLTEKVVSWWPKDPQAHLVHGICLMTIGDQPGSIAALERALALDPNDQTIRVALSVAGKGPAPAPDLMKTEGIFDAYAESFDSHLVEQLNYRVPEKLAEIFASSGRVWDRMLDLGCGTGLTGASLYSYARHITGVDLSEPMIAKAKERGIYHTLYKGDCVAFLQQIESTYDLMVSTDVLVYFGDLTQLFRAARARLAPGGVFWFSVEEHPGEGFGVALSHRYQHSLSYIRKTAQAAGLRLIHEQPIDIRLEREKPVPGFLVALERPDDFPGDKSWQFQPGGAA